MEEEKEEEDDDEEEEDEYFLRVFILFQHLHNTWKETLKRLTVTYFLGPFKFSYQNEKFCIEQISQVHFSWFVDAL